jgi:hypothetical protein
MLEPVLPFWASIGVLSLAQGAVVALPRAVAPGGLARLGGRAWALVPPLSVIGFFVIASAAERASADGLTYLALVAVPILAAGALAWAARGGRPWLALLVLPLFALAWAGRGHLWGEGAALVLTALSCVTLGVLLAAVTPASWLGVGIVAMALADTALVVSDLLQRPNNALNAAHPALGLPRLQSTVFGTAVIGYGDLFVAAVLGALLAGAFGRRAQLQGAALTALLAVAFDLLFFAVRELPATVPVAAALLVMLAARRRSSRRISRPAQAVPATAAPARARPVP